jgi:hypothetical protein
MISKLMEQFFKMDSLSAMIVVGASINVRFRNIRRFASAYSRKNVLFLNKADWLARRATGTVLKLESQK